MNNYTTNLVFKAEQWTGCSKKEAMKFCNDNRLCFVEYLGSYKELGNVIEYEAEEGMFELCLPGDWVTSSLLHSSLVVDDARFKEHFNQIINAKVGPDVKDFVAVKLVPK